MDFYKNISYDKISSLTEEDLDYLAFLDSKGFLVGSYEDIESYKKRILTYIEHIKKIKQNLEYNGTIQLYKGLRAVRDDVISEEILSEASNTTIKHYNFSLDWVLGFFFRGGFLSFTGGFAITLDNSLSILAIRKAFSKRKKWLWYDINELLAHELCHVAREPLNDSKYEELFAYRISNSKLRRYIGSAFIYPMDSVLLLLPILTVLLIEILKFMLYPKIKLIYVWPIILIYPTIMILRALKINRKYYKAAKKLKKFGINYTDSILFRSTATEIEEITRLKFNSKYDIVALLKKRAANSLRWRVIYKRFIKKC